MAEPTRNGSEFFSPVQRRNYLNFYTHTPFPPNVQGAHDDLRMVRRSAPN